MTSFSPAAVVLLRALEFFQSPTMVFISVTFDGSFLILLVLCSELVRHPHPAVTEVIFGEFIELFGTCRASVLLFSLIELGGILRSFLPL